MKAHYRTGDPRRARLSVVRDSRPDRALDLPRAPRYEHRRALRELGGVALTCALIVAAAWLLGRAVIYLAEQLADARPTGSATMVARAAVAGRASSPPTAPVGGGGARFSSTTRGPGQERVAPELIPLDWSAAPWPSTGDATPETAPHSRAASAVRATGRRAGHRPPPGRDSIDHISAPRRLP